ncbi:MAG: transcription termination factor NusA [Spiroplasma sp.]|nr:transcription termination factor NusA [Mycoplasmatales bacterium]
MTKNQKIFAGIDALVASEGLDRELVIDGLEEAVAIACRKYYEIENIEVNFNYETKRVTIHGFKEVQDPEVLGEAFDKFLYYTLEEAVEIKAKAKIGDVIKTKLKLVPELMDRSTIQTAKQVFRQKLREAKYRKIVEDYGDKVGEIIYGVLEEHRDPFMYFMLPGNIDATLGPKGQIPNEKIEPDVPIMLMVEQIAPQSKKGPKIIVSRTSSKIVEKTMEANIPEIESGLIKIKSIARDAGKRSKVAVELQDLDSDIDVIGSCVGSKGLRINKVRKEINGENIDLIEYFDDVIIYISNALAPALVTAVQILDEEEKQSRVIVPDDQLSLAIGAAGQNVRLASKLTEWKIDIKSETDAIAEGINFEDDII